MTAEIHTCSYSCERPECIRAQRDELAARMTAETSNARGEWVLVPRELLDEARNIAMEWTLKGRVPECGKFGQIAQDLDAMLAAAPQPPSAPVGVEAIAAEIRASLGRGATVCTRRRWAIELEALAQQPAALDGADTLLRDLVEALDAAFISSWQSTAAWQKQLDAAREYLAAQHQEPTT